MSWLNNHATYFQNKFDNWTIKFKANDNRFQTMVDSLTNQLINAFDKYEFNPDGELLWIINWTATSLYDMIMKTNFL